MRAMVMLYSMNLAFAENNAYLTSQAFHILSQVAQRSGSPAKPAGQVSKYVIFLITSGANCGTHFGDIDYSIRIKAESL